MANIQGWDIPHLTARSLQRPGLDPDAWTARAKIWELPFGDVAVLAYNIDEGSNGAYYASVEILQNKEEPFTVWSPKFLKWLMSGPPQFATLKAEQFLIFAEGFIPIEKNRPSENPFVIVRVRDWSLAVARFYSAFSYSVESRGDAELEFVLTNPLGGHTHLRQRPRVTVDVGALSWQLPKNQPSSSAQFEAWLKSLPGPGDAEVLPEAGVRDRGKPFAWPWRKS